MENRIGWLGQSSGDVLVAPDNIVYDVNGDPRELSDSQLSMVENEAIEDPIAQLMAWGDFSTRTEAEIFLENHQS